MKAISLMVFLVLATAISISVSSIISPWTMVQAQNKISPENKNDTRQIINLKDSTITLVNKTTNETLSTTPYPGKTDNTTTNETNKMIIPGKTDNTTTNETNKMIIPGKTDNTTTNETNMMIIPGKTGNTSINENLSERLSKLAK